MGEEGRRGRVWPRPQPPTHVSRVLPLQRALALLLLEQRHVLGLQPRDGLGPVVLGVKMDFPDLGGRECPMTLWVRGWQSLPGSDSAFDLCTVA